jgi:plasmid maintenance system killer protein
MIKNNTEKVFELKIEEDDEVSGVDSISLVDEPAIEFNWVAFKKEVEHEFHIPDGEDNNYSSQKANLEATLALLEATKDNKSVWEKKSKHHELKEGDYGNPYKKMMAQTQSLAEITFHRIESCDDDPDILKLSHKIGKRIKGYAGVTPKKNKPSLTEQIATKNITDDEIIKAAKLVKNENYKSLCNISYEIRRAAISYLLYDKSGDDYFDTIADKLPSLKTLITEKGQGLDLEI